MKRAACVLMAALWLFAFTGVHANMQPVKVYLVDPCGGCADVIGCSQCAIEDEIYLRYRALLESIGQEDRSIVLYNMRRMPGAYAELENRLAGFGIETFALPILSTGDAIFPADGTQDGAIAAYLSGDISAYEGYTPPAQRDSTPSHTAERSILFLSTAFCEDCVKVEKFLARALPKDMAVRKYDIGTLEGMRMEQAVHAYYSLAEDTKVVPLVVYGDHVLIGWQQIVVALLSRIEEEPNAITPEDAALLSALSIDSLPDSKITYLYVSGCTSCAQVKAMLSALPEQLEIADAQGIRGLSSVVIREVDGSDREAAHALFEAYGVPDAKQIAPSVFLAETYYAGADAILADLERALLSGEAISANADANEPARTD